MRMHMKKPYMRTIIGSCGRDCVLIILFFQFMVLSLPFLKVISSGWVSMTPPPPPPSPHIGKKTSAILITIINIINAMT